MDKCLFVELEKFCANINRDDLLLSIQYMEHCLTWQKILKMKIEAIREKSLQKKKQIMKFGCL